MDQSEVIKLDRGEKKKERNIKCKQNKKEKKQEAAEEYSRELKEMKKSVKRDKDIFLNESHKADKAERAASAGHQGTLYQMSKTLTGKKNKMGRIF